MPSFLQSLKRSAIPLDVVALALLTILLNGHLVSDAFTPQHFHPAALASGEWWRLLTHPFVHVSFSHLAMDALGFFSLYLLLDARRPLRRLLDVAFCAIGSLVLALLFSDRVGEIGLCGLSGVAHGLMAVVGLEMATSPEGRDARARVGAAALALVTLKVAVEAWFGDTLFAGLALGGAGEAVAVCHLGGVLGGLIGRLFRAAYAGGDHPGRTSSSPCSRARAAGREGALE